MNRRSIRGSIRQAMQPAAFRIQTLPSNMATLTAASALAKAIADTSAAATTSDAFGSAQREASIKVLCDLANGVWRLKRRMLEPGTDRPKEPFRREFSHVESLQDVLFEAGMEIQDHTGQTMRAGMSLREIDRIPTQGVSRDRVQQTIKPTLYFNGVHVQRGEVIVETPPAEGPNAE